MIILLQRIFVAWQGLAIRQNRVNLERDKFMDYGFAPFIDALTDDRLYNRMGLPLYSPATLFLRFCSIPASY